jgi:hypothetical protein
MICAVKAVSTHHLGRSGLRLAALLLPGWTGRAVIEQQLLHGLAAHVSVVCLVSGFRTPNAPVVAGEAFCHSTTQYKYCRRGSPSRRTSAIRDPKFERPLQAMQVIIRVRAIPPERFGPLSRSVLGLQGVGPQFRRQLVLRCATRWPCDAKAFLSLPAPLVAPSHIRPGPRCCFCHTDAGINGAHAAVVGRRPLWPDEGR